MLSDGIFSLPWKQYRALDRTHWSTLKHFSKSPAHFRWWETHEPEDSDSLKRGRVVDMAVFEPERFGVEVAKWDGDVRRGKRWDEFQAEHRGQEICTETEYDKAVALGAAIRNSPEARPFLTGGKAQQSILWTVTQPSIGELAGYEIACKGRIDYLTPTALIDLKTTRDASFAGFSRECAKYRYAAQLSMYRDGLVKATGLKLPVYIIAAEAEPPYVVQVFHLPPAVLDKGREEYRAHLDSLGHCRATGCWPSYFDGPVDLTLPSWSDDNVDSFGLELAS